MQKYNDNNITKFCQFVQYPCSRTCSKSSHKLVNLQRPVVLCVESPNPCPILSCSLFSHFTESFFPFLFLSIYFPLSLSLSLFLLFLYQFIASWPSHLIGENSKGILCHKSLQIKPSLPWSTPISSFSQIGSADCHFSEPCCSVQHCESLHHSNSRQCWEWKSFSQELELLLSNPRSFSSFHSHLSLSFHSIFSWILQKYGGSVSRSRNFRKQEGFILRMCSSTVFGFPMHALRSDLNLRESERERLR